MAEDVAETPDLKREFRQFVIKALYRSAGIDKDTFGGKRVVTLGGGRAGNDAQIAKALGAAWVVNIDSDPRVRSPYFDENITGEYQEKLPSVKLGRGTIVTAIGLESGAASGTIPWLMEHLNQRPEKPDSVIITTDYMNKEAIVSSLSKKNLLDSLVDYNIVTPEGSEETIFWGKYR